MQRSTSGAFHLILRVLMRIASRSREAMVPMNTTDSLGEPGQGRGLVPSPHNPDPEHDAPEQGSPTRQIGAVFMGNVR
jgi:hypothetical protein